MDFNQAEQVAKGIINKKGRDALKEVVDLLYESFHYYDWVGIYIVQGDDLVLDPWRGKQPTEHTRIPLGTGICGAAAATGNVELVNNVQEDARYLACFITTKSELVLPIKKEGKVVGEIDIDSNKPQAFTSQDVALVQRLAVLLSDVF